MKNNDGEIYLPGVFNQVGDLIPGQGYLIKLSEAATLIYADN